MNESTRLKLNFNDGWLFMLGDVDGGESPNLDDSGWRKLKLPHDWSVEYPVAEAEVTGGGGGYAVTGVGWYRKRFTAPAEARGKLVSILFDGVFMDSAVYLNGELIGGRAYGYSEFDLPLDDCLKEGENVLAVRVNNSLQPNSRWYTGSGIYRNTWLVATGEIHIARNGVFCQTNGLYNDYTAARQQVQAWVENDSDDPVDVGVEQTLLDADGNEAGTGAVGLHVEPGSIGEAMVMIAVDKPHLWSNDDPYLYTLVTTVSKGGEVVDKLCTKVGIRTATFDCDRGFLLNDVPVKIKGMCIHHDGGVTGAAFYRQTWERRLRALKDMGCNGIRTAHNPPAAELLDLCDEMGFLVMDEAFDEWQLGKFKSATYGYSQQFVYGYAQHFSENAEDDLLTMLHRDRNHPSVILWSIGNEIPEQSAVEGLKILTWLQDICHQEDPSRMVCSAVDNLAAPETFRTRREFECALDVVGYNYTGRWGMRAETLYDEDRKMFPKRRIVGSENPSAGGTRGNYDRNADPRMFRNSYDTATHNNEFLWRYTASRDFVAGDYLWTGIDYLGEARWPMKGSQAGAIDTAGFEKDTYYYFRSIWNDRDTTLHILPHWNWAGREGEFFPVIGYTNCEEVKLYLNGRLVGTKGFDFPNVGALGAWNVRAKNTRPTTHDLHLSWDVPYEPGELKAVGYVGGKEVAEAVIKTTGAPASLKAVADCPDMKVDDIAHIDICASDAAGLCVPDAKTAVTAKVEGPLAYLGMDNGFQGDLKEFGAAERCLHAGRLLCVVRADGVGEGKVTLSAEGMEDVVLTFTIK